MNESTEIAVFGGGCFWCTEAIFEQLDGVKSVMPGYAGGTVKNPTYRRVCTGMTGHAEVVLVEYDPLRVPYRDLMTVKGLYNPKLQPHRIPCSDGAGIITASFQGERVTVSLTAPKNLRLNEEIPLSIGAQAVLTGRATLFGVIAGGEPGARRALEILSGELERSMKLCGARSVAEIGPDLIYS